MRSLALGLPLLLAIAVSAQTPSGPAVLADAAVPSDTRLTDALDAAGLQYDVDPAGRVQMVYTGIGDAADRLQQVSMSPRTVTLAGREFREIWSVAVGATGKEVSTKLAARLLDVNAITELGGWATEDGAVFFRVTVPADASADDLAYYTEIVATTADSLEAELSTTDEF